MTIDEEIKRRIIDLHSNEHVTNRKISKIVKKSSRDIIAVLKVSENKEIADEIIESTLYQGDYQFVKEKVLVIADKTFHKLTRDLAENFIYSRRIGKGNFIFCGNGRIRNRRCRFVRNQTHTKRFG